MKKIFHILFPIPLALLLTACLGDNYEQPNAAVYGSAIDAETGELILQDMGGEGSYIEMLEMAYSKPDTRRLNFKTDGTYRDNNFFKGDYRVQFNLTNFDPSTVELISKDSDIREAVDTAGKTFKIIHLNGDTQMEIKAKPWCRVTVKDIVFDEAKQRVLAKFEVECTTRDKLKEIGLFCDPSPHVSYSINNYGDNSTKRVAVNKVLTGPQEFTLKMPLTMFQDRDSDKDYYLRVGAHTSAVDARWNYAPAVKLHIVKKEIVQKPLGIRWDLFDSKYLDMWEAGKHKSVAQLYFDTKDYKSGDGSVVTVSYSEAESNGYTQFLSPGEGKGGIKPVFDISAIPAEGCHMLLTLNVSDASHFERSAFGQIEIGSNGIFDDEECAWTFGMFELRNGWQTLDLSLPGGAYIGELRRKRINWFRFYHLHEFNGPTTVKFDEIRFYYKTMMESCDDIAGWQSAGALKLDEADCQEGEGSVSTVNGASGIRLQKTWGAEIVPTPFEGGHFQFWLYVSDASAFNGVDNQVEIGSGGKADTDELNWKLPTLQDGWNKVDLKLSDATSVGEPMNLKAMNWFRIYSQTTAPAGTVTVKVDRLRFYKEGTDMSLADFDD
ncbi:MAG: DUF3823 domain-containing protein [Bacteroidales bacterium]|nr:DUF3823 domain-containing protein [Bacteroidales bacterium]